MSHTYWYKSARKAQEHWKATTPNLPDSARRPGLCMIEDHGVRRAVRPFPVCLPQEHADLNLLGEIRSDAIATFSRLGIQWHQHTEGPGGAQWPNTHLLDSQVQCVNVFLTLARRPGRLLQFARQFVPEATKIVSTDDDLPVAFEWIRLKDHLGESSGGKRQRGRFATSTDALVVVESPQGRSGILVEWKFTESYQSPVPFRGPGGKDRREIYRERFMSPTSPIDRSAPMEAFFQDPHYQLLRLHLLAAAMVEDHELGIDRAVVALVSPPKNEELHEVPSGLRPFGASLTEVWQRLVRGQKVSFRSMDSRLLLGESELLHERYAAMSPAPT